MKKSIQSQVAPPSLSSDPALVGAGLCVALSLPALLLVSRCAPISQGLGSKPPGSWREIAADSAAKALAVSEVFVCSCPPGPFAPSPKARENGCASLFSSPLDAVCHVLPSVIAPDIPMAWCCGLTTSWAGACFCPAWPCVAAPRFAGAWCGNQHLPHASNAVSACS